jgi:trans-aconitate 2-methyltransferase
MDEWNPDLYLQYSNQRNQPVKDLLSRIPLPEVKSVLDYGCGPGNSTHLVSQKWEKARIVGIDSSGAMIDKARASYPDIEWKLQDIMTWNTSDKFNVVFSNAVIQWIFNQEKLMEKLAGMAAESGVIAFQMPEYGDMPVARIIDEEYHKLCRSDTFSIADVFEFHRSDWYYNTLCRYSAAIDMWQTDYIHEMKSTEDIVTMIESTGLRPYLARLESEEQKHQLLENSTEALKKEYHECTNGKVLFPFKRLFVVAYKGI